MMALYESIPSKIEAVQWTGGNGPHIKALFGSKVVFEYMDSELDPHLSLLAGKDGAQGYAPVPHGHWLVHNPDDLTDIWPVDPDYFGKKYRRATEWHDCPECGVWTTGPNGAVHLAGCPLGQEGGGSE